MRARLLIITSVVILSGCVKETSWPLKDPLPSTATIIVDGIITDEVKAHAVRLTYPMAELNLEPEAVTGAGVVISNEDSTWQLTENPAGSGIYTTPSSFHSELQKTYTLLISVDDRIFTAKASMTAGALFRELEYELNPENDLYFIEWVASGFNAETPAMWEVLLDWSQVPGYEKFDSTDTHARMLFYTLTTLDVTEVFAPMMEKVFFPAGTVITERRYSLSVQHAEFIRGMLLETNWAGGLFPVAAANTVTNLSNGAFGFFGACAVTELSLTVTP
jgi:hypothetical protein